MSKMAKSKNSKSSKPPKKQIGGQSQTKSAPASPLLRHVLIVVLKEGQEGESGELKVLLVKRKFPPYAHEYALPGGFIKPDETPIQAALRELSLEVGISPLRGGMDLVPLSTRTKANRDPRGEVTDYVFLLVMDKLRSQSVQVGANLENAGFVDVEKIHPPIEGANHGGGALGHYHGLAFDHEAILCEALSFGHPLLVPFIQRPTVSAKDWKPHFKLPASLHPSSISGETELIIYGGTFNPWHQGHEACLQLVPHKNIIVILDNNPWKHNLNGATAKERDHFTRLLALSNILLPFKISLYSGHFGLESETPTIDWIDKIKGHELSLLVGADNFYSLLRWKHAESLIAKLKRLYVAPRECQAEDKDVEKKLKQINSKLEIVHLADHQYKHISSSNLRKTGPNGGPSQPATK